jgi:tetratricopeptide (TPR) repeat protein
MRFATLRVLVPSLFAFALSAAACHDEAAPPAVKRLAPTVPGPVAALESPALRPAADGGVSSTVVTVAKDDAGHAVAVVPVAPAAPGAAAAPAAAAADADAEPPDDGPGEFVLPPTFDGRMVYGRHLAAQGKTDDAVVAFQGALVLRPASERPHVEMARAYLDAGDLRSARAHADLAVAATPTSSSAWNTRGRVLFVARETSMAIESFTRATQADGDNAYAWNNLGLALMADKHWDEAIAALEVATGLAHPEPYMFANLGEAYEKAGRIAEARTAYQAGARHRSSESRAALLRLGELKAEADGAQSAQ